MACRWSRYVIHGHETLYHGPRPPARGRTLSGVAWDVLWTARFVRSAQVHGMIFAFKACRQILYSQMQFWTFLKQAGRN